MAKQPTSTRLEQSALHLLHRASQRAAEIFQNEIDEADLTPRQYAVLSCVALHEGASQTLLVEKTGIDRSTLADIVRRMLKKGLLQRRRTREDARTYAVKLTDEGMKALKAVDPIARKVDERVLGTLLVKDRSRFMTDLSTIVCGLGNGANGSATSALIGKAASAKKKAASKRR